MAPSLPAPLWILAGVLVGFIAGGVGPRRDLVITDQDLARAQDDLIKARRRLARRSPLAVVGLDRAGAPVPTESAPRTKTSRSQTRTVPPDETPDDALDTGDVVADDDLTDGSPGDQLEQFELAVDAQRLRIDQSRAALAEQADLDDDQLAAVDAATAEMNSRLAELGDDLLDTMNDGGDPDSRQLLGLTHEVSGILYDAQVELDDTIGGDMVDAVQPEAREIWNYVDLESFRDTMESAAQDQSVAVPPSR